MADFKLDRNEFKEVYGVKVYRIIYSDGTKGGWAEKMRNLKRTRWCHCKILDEAVVMGNAEVSGGSVVSGNAFIYGNVRLYGNSQVTGNARVYGNVKVFGNAKITDNASVCGDSIIADNAKIGENAIICSSTFVGDNAVIGGETELFGAVEIVGDAVLKSNKDYIIFKEWWNSNNYITWTRSNNKWCLHNIPLSAEEIINKLTENGRENDVKEFKRLVDYINLILSD